MMLQQRINRLMVLLKRRDYYPSLAVEAGGAYGNPEPISGFVGAFTQAKKFNWYAQASLSFNIFDGGVLRFV